MKPSMSHLWIALAFSLVTIIAWTPGASVALQGDATPAPGASSGEQPIFGFVPVGETGERRIVIELAPGDSQTLSVGVANAGEMPVALRTYATNAITITNGGFGAGDEGDDPTGAAAWLDYPAATVEVAPNQVQHRDITITVPPDAIPGEHQAALIVQNVDPIPIPGNEMFNQVVRKAMSVTVTVPGPVTPGFSLGEPFIERDTFAISLVVPIQNTGNVRVAPSGELVVTSDDGDEVTRSSIELGTIYAGHETVIYIPIPDQFPPGDYLVSLDVTDAETGASDGIASAPISIAPPATPEAEPAFTVDEASVTPNGDPVQFADVSATMVNNGSDIPTANVTLIVMRDGEKVERYPLAEGKALPQGSTGVGQRYIPVDGWQPGTWTFALEVSAVSGDTETVIATVEIPDGIIIP